MNNYKHTALWALSGVAIGLFAFIFNYTLVPLSLPGYEIFAGPAMIALSFFSEELYFWPKMVIFILGQYLAYFFIITVIKKVIKYFNAQNLA